MTHVHLRAMKSQTDGWIDSHAHLTMFEPEEVSDVLGRAADAGVVGVLVPATSPDDLGRTVALARTYPDRVVAAVGVHPHDAGRLDHKVRIDLERSLAAPGVVAVGEIGLDYHYMSSPREDQLQALEWQLDLAIEADLPVVLHNRESWADLEPRLASRAGRLRGVCHSFTEGAEAARRVVDLGLVIGISGMVTFKGGGNIREMAAAVPPARAMVETDSPYLAPVPHRGQRNEPAFVVRVGEQLAEVWGLAAADVSRATSDCFRSLFGRSGVCA